MRKDIRIGVSYWGSKDDLVEVLQAIADGKLKPPVETRPMSECAEVLKEMQVGLLRNRVALIP